MLTLCRCAHLHLNNQAILGDVAPLKLCPNLRVLYLYENKLTSLRGVSALRKLTHLYAQQNELADLDEFEAPPALAQLYLSGNRLSHIKGLGGCTALRELELSNQRAPPPPAADADEEEEEDGSDAGSESVRREAGKPGGGGGGGARPAPLSLCAESLLAISPTLVRLEVPRRATHGALPHRAPSTRCTADSAHHVWRRLQQ